MTYTVRVHTGWCHWIPGLREPLLGAHQTTGGCHLCVGGKDQDFHSRVSQGHELSGWSQFTSPGTDPACGQCALAVTPCLFAGAPALAGDEDAESSDRPFFQNPLVP